MKRFALIFIPAMLIPLSAFAQMNYSNNGSATGYSVVDNIKNCGAISCWHTPPQQTSYQFFSASVGGDGFVCGVTTARGIMCRTEYPANAWSSLPAQLSGVYGIAVGDQSNIWALSGTCSGDAAAGYSIWQLSGNSWVQRSGCGTTITFDESDGLVYVTNGHVSSNNGSSWTQLPGAGTQISAARGFVAMVGTDGNAYVSAEQVFTGWAYASCGATAPGGVLFSNLTIDEQGNLYAVAKDSNVYYCGQSWSTSKWNKLAVPVMTGYSSSVASVSTADPLTTWSVVSFWYLSHGRVILGPSYLYRFSEYGVQFSATLSGSGTCSGCFVNGQCCPVTHTGDNNVGWKGPAVSSTTGTLSATINANGGSFSGTTTSTLLDVFSCLESDASCTPVADQSVTCSAMGRSTAAAPCGPFPISSTRRPKPVGTWHSRGHLCAPALPAGIQRLIAALPRLLRLTIVLRVGPSSFQPRILMTQSTTGSYTTCAQATQGMLL